MGREIRRVPKGWEHPRGKNGFFLSLYDQTFDDAARAWWHAAVQWHNGTMREESERQQREKYPWYWQWDGPPPDEKYYRPAFTSPADCYQIYETVSEGTPVSPVFESVEAMLAWMTQPIDRALEYNTGEDWQSMQGMTREQAERFCGRGSSVSMIFSPGTGMVAGHRL